MSLIRSYRDLKVWQRAMELVVEVTRLVRQLPQADRFVFETQIRRAALSIPANIAEGHQRRHLGDYLRLLSYARGSLAEVETDLCAIGGTVENTPANLQRCFDLATETGKMLTALSMRLRKP